MRQVLTLGLALAALCASPAAMSADLVITGARVYPAPGSAPIDNAAVLVRNDRIVSVGPAAAIDAGADATVIDAEGGVVLAGFWNSHVHFTEPKWAGAAELPAPRLESQLREMLVRYGFTSVVDTGSDPRDTFPMRTRIESGEIAGPRIITAMSPLFPPDGVPYYLRDLPPELLSRLSQPASPEEAAATVRANLAAGGDVVKVFTGAWVQQGRPAKPMPVGIASAAVAEAHRQDVLVFTHPSDVAGLEVALASGVDVLAHSVEDLDGFDHSHLQRMREQDMALVPTLKLFSVNPEPTLDAILKEVGDYQQLGGSIWFGTDVGFIEDYDPALEFELLQRAGLSFDQILAALTTSPASRLPGGEGRGQVEAGMIADLVVLDGDPARDPKAWTRLRYVFRDGGKIYDAALETHPVQ
ncbi:amidohydrolase family protein [Lysobacter sp. F6437]|uniref:amidohydrolase family protein n=1 Tax=Lysobacter sp. F6437 TaxID=3459296 RepID=UPI00403DA6EB